MEPRAAVSQQVQHGDHCPGRVQVALASVSWPSALLGGAGRVKAQVVAVVEEGGGQKAETVNEVVTKDDMDQRARLQGKFSEEVQDAESGP